MDFNAVTAQFSKFVHEETHAGPGCSDHLRKRLLTDFRDNGLRFPFLAKVCQQQEQPGETFLARIEQLIHKVCFDADAPAHKMGDEHLGERWFLMDHAEELLTALATGSSIPPPLRLTNRSSASSKDALYPAGLSFPETKHVTGFGVTLPPELDRVRLLTLALSSRL